MLINKICLNCQNPFSRQLSPKHIKRGKGKYCSRECCVKHFYILRSVGTIKPNLKGLELGRQKGRNVSQVTRDKISKSLLGKCGELARNWKGGVYETYQDLRRSPLHKQWRRDIVKRDNYECQICATVKEPLHANHIKKFIDFPDLRLIQTNGITLCANCHIKKVTGHESEWESYFNFNLITRGFLEDNICQ